MKKKNCREPKQLAVHGPHIYFTSSRFDSIVYDDVSFAGEFQEPFDQEALYSPDVLSSIYMFNVETGFWTNFDVNVLAKEPLAVMHEEMEVPHGKLRY